MPSLVKKKKKGAVEDEAVLAKTHKIADLALSKKARDFRAYNVSGLTLVADSLLLCTVNSEPQMKAVYNAVFEGMKEIGVPPLRSEGAYGDGWLIMDYGTVLFHVFREKARHFYDLDGMWADAPEIKLDLDGIEEKSPKP